MSVLRRSSLPLLLLGTAFLYSAGCGDDDVTGPGSDTSGVRVSLHVEGTGGSSKRATAGHISITSLVVQVAEIVFDAEGPAGSISVTEEQNSSVNVVEGTATPDLVTIELTSGTYTSVNLGIEVLDDGAEPAIVLEGVLDGTPIRFVFNSAEVFEADAATLVIPEDETVNVRFILNPAAWFADFTSDDLTVGSDGVALISSTSNADVFDQAADLLDETTQSVFPGGTSDDL